MAVVKFTISFIVAFAVCPVFAALPEKLPATVAGPRYGTALFEYYQNNFFDALSELGVISQSRNAAADKNARILEAHFSLAYGMEHRAAALFQELSQANYGLALNDAPWFNLARLHYLRSDWQAAAQALAKVSSESSRAYAAERDFLQVNLAIRQGQFDEVVEILQQGLIQTHLLPYVYYNLGAAKSRAGDYQAAVNFYNQLADLPLESEEHFALNDKAMIAAGYSYLQNGQYAEAQAQFSRVRLSSPLSSRALLGYGWSAAEQNDYLEALTPWQYLAEQSLVDENTQEALLAVPFAYENLGNQGLALQYFEQAEQRVSHEIDAIEQLLASLEGDALLDTLGIAEVGENVDWLSYLPEQPLSPQLTYLAELFSRDSFQVQVQELRELIKIRQKLTDWQQKLTLYSAMLDERTSQRRRHNEYLKQQQLDETLTRLRGERNELAAEIGRVAREQDYFALLAGPQADSYNQLRKINKGIAGLAAANADTEEYTEAARRYKGLLLWQAAEDFAARLWHTRKQLAELDDQLHELEATKLLVQKTYANRPDIDRQRARLNAGEQRLHQQLAELDKAIAEGQQQLRDQTVSVLNEQRERLRYYLTESRLAVARLYDSARVEQH